MGRRYLSEFTPPRFQQLYLNLYTLIPLNIVSSAKGAEIKGKQKLEANENFVFLLEKIILVQSNPLCISLLASVTSMSTLKNQR